MFIFQVVVVISDIKMSYRYDDSSNFHYIYSCDLDLNVKIKVGTLEGKLPRPSYEQVIDRPILRFAGRNQSHTPDLVITVVVTSSSVPLHLPVTTPYKTFSQRWAWNTWLTLPLKFSELPLDSLLCFTVWDCNGPGEREAVGGSSISLFGKKGILRSGMLDLVVWPSEEGSEETPGKLKDSDKEQYHRLAKLSKKYHAGKIQPVDWLDRITFAEIERISQKDKSASAKLYLNIEFPHTMDMDLPISVVYFEQGGDNVVYSPESNEICPLPDPDIGLDNLIEAKHHKLARSARTGLSERDSKPNPETRNRLNNILAAPVTQALSSEELDLIWRFRYYLANNKKALSKFVRCVKWSVEVEAEQAMDLISTSWVPMDVEDALELVGPNWRHPSLRRYAVSRLAQASDEDLLLYLLQLVQALKYENYSEHKRRSKEVESEAGGEYTDLASFLISRANQNQGLANYLYWYLHIETEEEDNIQAGSVAMYKQVLDTFLKQSPYRETLARQHKFIESLVQLLGLVSKESSNRKKKIEKLQQLLKDNEQFGIDFSNFSPLPLPLNPSVNICGIVASKATLFKSSLMPARLTFITSEKEEYIAIFKNGDDLRQDQLILQIISLMDQLLRRENLDLKLTPYNVLAISSKYGFLQFVEATGIADILSSENSILNFFRKHNPSETGPYGVSADCLDTYVKSCAGYCVITYLLGVGDRHLDNLMLSKTGKLVHVDFGYILGRDPKPLPPPMKLSREMIEGFGGVNSEHYQEFRKECYTAFLYLRRNASLILNLFSLMVDANVPDIALEPDKAVRKVQDKFRLDLNEEEAVKYMQKLIDDSANAIMPAVAERFHQFAMYWKK